ncbi:MAG: hypothetical protein ACFE89_05645 [Candidatus Hodarchaeota archaeon]
MGPASDFHGRVMLVIIISCVLVSGSFNHQVQHVNSYPGESLPPWLRSGTYAEYSMNYDPLNWGSVSVWAYNESMESVHFAFDEEQGDEFVYRWDVVEIDSGVVNLSVHIFATGWINQTFPMLLNLTDYVVYHIGDALGVARFWVDEEDLVSDLVLFSTPWMTVKYQNHHPGVSGEILLQGFQIVLYTTAEADLEGENHHSSLTYDESEGLFLRALSWTAIPFPLEYRVRCLIADLVLVATNVWLGPDILPLDFGGLVELSGIILGLIFLGAVFVIIRRHQQIMYNREMQT